MSPHLYQILLVIVAGLMINQAVIRYITRQPQQTVLKLATRLVIWGGMAWFSLFPDHLQVAAYWLAIPNDISALTILGFLIIFLLTFKLLSLIEEQERKLTILTRHLALRDANLISPDNPPTSSHNQ